MIKNIYTLMFGSFFIAFVYTGCTASKIGEMENDQIVKTSHIQLSCEEKAEVKSLQYLEQQYRCHNLN